jgi:hypothetical protein
MIFVMAPERWRGESTADHRMAGAFAPALAQI